MEIMERLAALMANEKFPHNYMTLRVSKHSNAGELGFGAGWIISWKSTEEMIQKVTAYLDEQEALLRPTLVEEMAAALEMYRSQTASRDVSEKVDAALARYREECKK